MLRLYDWFFFWFLLFFHSGIRVSQLVLRHRKNLKHPLCVCTLCHKGVTGSNKNVTLTIYGRIPASQHVSAGSYTNAVTATINFCASYFLSFREVVDSSPGCFPGSNPPTSW